MDARRATLLAGEMFKVLGVPGTVFELFTSIYFYLRACISEYGQLCRPASFLIFFSTFLLFYSWQIFSLILGDRWVSG